MVDSSGGDENGVSCRYILKTEPIGLATGQVWGMSERK